MPSRRGVRAAVAAASPRAVAALVLVVMGLFVAARLVLVADGDVGAFVVRGERSGPPGVSSDVPVVEGLGYDGQYYYRMALAPTHLEREHAGIVLDDDLRRARIGYPVVVHALALGQAGAVPWALVVVNVLCLALAAGLAASWARAHGHAPAWGLLVAGYGGMVTSVSRDLTEPLALALLLAALVALRAGRRGLAVLAMSGAVLTRETALLLPVALLLVAAWRVLRDRRRPSSESLLWAVPVAVWVAWEVLVTAVYGTVPVVDQRRNTAVPLTAFADALVRWVTEPDLIRVICLVQLLSLVVVVALAVRTARRDAPSYLLVAMGLGTALLLSLSERLWIDDPAAFRTFVDVHLYATAALLATRPSRGLALAAVATGGVWLLSAAFRLHAL